MSTIRIDSLRNRLTTTQQLLATITTELEDLHILAYERHTAAREAPVNGGTRDWALDTHGNPNARTAYRNLAETTIGACTNLAEAAHNAIRLLRETNPGETPRTRRIINTAEYASTLAAQARRNDRGDYTPTRIQPQPEIDRIKHTIDRLIRERDQATALADRYARRLERYEPAVTSRARRRRRKTG